MSPLPPLPSRPDGRPVCKACRQPLDWDNMKRVDREIHPRVFERAYVCPHCRAVQEFASWQTGISRKD